MKAIIVKYYNFYGDVKTYVGICNDDKVDDAIAKIYKESTEVFETKVVNAYKY